MMKCLSKMLKLISIYCPLLILVVAVYFMVVPLYGPGILMESLISFEMISGSDFSITVSDTLIMLGLILLYFEILKSTGSSLKVVIEHTVSLLMFIVCLLAFLALEMCGNSTFFLITIMTLLDVVAGFTVTIATSRRDISFGGNS